MKLNRASHEAMAAVEEAATVAVAVAEAATAGSSPAFKSDLKQEAAGRFASCESFPIRFAVDSVQMAFPFILANLNGNL